MLKSPGLRFFLLLLESLLVLCGFFLTLHFAHHASLTWAGISLVQIKLKSVFSALALLVVWLFWFTELHYAPAQTRTRAALLRHMLTGLCLLTCALILALCLTSTQVQLRRVVSLFWLWSLPLTFVMTFLGRFLDRFVSSSEHHVIILGTGPIARKAWKEIRTKHFRRFKIVGFVDNRCIPIAPVDVQAQYLGTIADLEQILLRHAVDLIVIALPLKSCYESIQQAIGIGEQVGVNFITFDHTFQSNLAGIAEQHPRPVFDHAQSLHGDLARVSKRVFDVVISAFLLCFLAPLLIAIGAAVKLTSQGPALFIQERYGYRRRRFALLKFRTMVNDAEQRLPELEAANEAVGPIFKMKRDPRVTPLGQYLRKTSLDELPQLWNVLVGDMSLVGPRPMSIRDVSLFDAARLMRRFQVKPGITGLWQVSGRSNTTFDHWIAMDFRYIDKWSLWLDLQILFRTIPVVLKGSGAV